MDMKIDNELLTHTAQQGELTGMDKHSLIDEVRNLKAENQMLKDELLSLKALLFLRDKTDELIRKIVTNDTL